MKILLAALLVLLAGCASPEPVLGASDLTGCAKRYDLLEERFCEYSRAEKAGTSSREVLGKLTQDSLMFVVECEQDHPDWNAPCGGR